MKKLISILSLALIASYLVAGCSAPEESGTTGTTAGETKTDAGETKTEEGK